MASLGVSMEEKYYHELVKKLDEQAALKKSNRSAEARQILLEHFAIQETHEWKPKSFVRMYV
jgi:hypothetical protein